MEPPKDLVDALFAAAEKFDRMDFGRKPEVVYEPPFVVKERIRTDGRPIFGIVDANDELFKSNGNCALFDGRDNAQYLADKLNGKNTQ
jgi:hypothetical protein